MKNWLAIVNPRAGGIRSPGKLRSVVEQLRNLGASPVFTEKPGHAQELAGDAAKFDGVLIAGGDGTLMEVLNGNRASERRLAILPCGRGNSLARDLGLYPMVRAFQALESGRFSCIDLMEASFEDEAGRHFQMLSASTIALGYPATVVRIASARFRWLGKYCYAAAAAGLAPAPMAVRISPGGEMQLTGFVANNTQHLGNFVGIPTASCHDGHFDVMEMSAGFIRQSMHNVSALSRLQFYTPATLRPMTEVSVTLERPEDLMIDGEIFPSVRSLRISVRRSAIQIAVPESPR